MPVDLPAKWRGLNPGGNPCHFKSDLGGLFLNGNLHIGGLPPCGPPGRLSGLRPSNDR